MTRNWFLLAFVCVSLVCLSALVGYSGPAYADSNASGSEVIHNGDSQHRTAVDLHFTIRLANWEGKNAGSSYWFKSWTITTNPALGGSQTTTTRVNPDGHVYAIDVNYININIPYCTTVRVDVDAVLYSWNSLVIDSLYFTYASGNPDRGAPTEGFRFPYAPIEVKAFKWHTTTYTLVNEDPSLPFTVHNLRFYMSPTWYPPSSWTGSVGTLIREEAGPITLPSNTSQDFVLDVPWSDGKSYIYVSGEKDYDPIDFDVREHRLFQNGHQETLYIRHPSLSTWGILLLALVLATAAVWLIRRKRALELP